MPKTAIIAQNQADEGNEELPYFSEVEIKKFLRKHPRAKGKVGVMIATTTLCALRAGNPIFLSLKEMYDHAFGIDGCRSCNKNLSGFGR